ncbi:AbgT family transporter [Conexibacter sp. CPCC 206217]|uniref:AbgT family transporter n=1 Tax=Conexibacter sp. CPCC 206217 TaxID=3064574 RepID=UPI0027293B67|nr:AbgT family transporter [Conexibacter sp. CPCC 206217]MDO8212030.1 AbgT family transporter [Conexibacter sp. CPCC 206217]
MSATASGHVDGTGGFGEGDGGGGFTQRALAWIERNGNKVPNPAILFLGLCIGVIVLSQILDWIGVSITSEVVDVGSRAVEARPDGVSALPYDNAPEHYAVVRETFSIRGLLTGDGIRFMFTSFVPNFLGFTAIGVILVAMVGVGVAELSGLVGGLIRKLVAISTAASLTFIIVFVGIISSIAADAGYLVLIPLAATAFLSVGRNPLAGIAAGFGAVSAAFGVNILIVPADAVITDITNEAAALVDPTTRIDLVSNLFFGIGCTIFLTIVIALVTTKIVEPRLGRWDRSLADEEELAREEGVTVDAALEAKGLRWAGLAVLGVLAVIALLTLPPGAPLRNPETGDIIGDSPFMSSLIVMISLAFLAAGIAYGRAVGTVRRSDDVLGMITRSWASLASLLFLFMLIAQFIAYFDYSNMAQVAAVWLGDILEELDLGDIWLLLGVIVVTIVVNFLIPAKIAKWAILAPIFVPLMLRLGIEPQTVLAAYRVGDSPTNVLTPLMPYFALMVVFAKRYQRDAGIGTVIALMLPYTVVLTIAWTLFFVAWYLIGIPLGPGWPVR